MKKIIIILCSILITSKLFTEINYKACLANQKNTLGKLWAAGVNFDGKCSECACATVVDSTTRKVVDTKYTCKCMNKTDYDNFVNFKNTPDGKTKRKPGQKEVNSYFANLEKTENRSVYSTSSVLATRDCQNKSGSLRILDDGTITCEEVTFDDALASGNCDQIQKIIDKKGGPRPGFGSKIGQKDFDAEIKHVDTVSGIANKPSCLACWRNSETSTKYGTPNNPVCVCKNLDTGKCVWNESDCINAGNQALFTANDQGDLQCTDLQTVIESVDCDYIKRIINSGLYRNPNLNISGGGTEMVRGPGRATPVASGCLACYTDQGIRYCSCPDENGRCPLVQR